MKNHGLVTLYKNLIRQMWKCEKKKFHPSYKLQVFGEGEGKGVTEFKFLGFYIEEAPRGRRIGWEIIWKRKGGERK